MSTSAGVASVPHLTEAACILKKPRLLFLVAEVFWVAVTELNLSYYNGETMLCTIYTPYGNLFKFLNSNPVFCRWCARVLRCKAMFRRGLGFRVLAATCWRFGLPCFGLSCLA